MSKKAEIYLSKDKYIGPLIKKYGKCTMRPRPKSEYFEDLVDAIVQQQLSVKAGGTIFARLKDKLGGKVTPKTLLALRRDVIRRCGLSNAKTNYIKDLARRVKDGKVEIHKMDKLPDDNVMEELVAVKGIGRWTAEMFLMFSLGRGDIFPVDDVGIINGMKKLTGRKMDKVQMEKFATRWKPHRTVASWYIWKSLDNS